MDTGQILYNFDEIPTQVFACVAAVRAIVDFDGRLYNLLDLGPLDRHPGFAHCLSSLILIIMILMTIYCRWYNIKWSKTLELTDLECDISSNSTPFNNRVPLKPSFRCLENDFTLKSNLGCDISRYSTHFNNGIPLKPSCRCLENYLLLI